MKQHCTVAVILCIASTVVSAQGKPYPQAKVSFDDFKALVAAVEAHRAERLIDFDTFLKKSKEPNVIILDTRSSFRFERIHLKGAQHLAFTDFTQKSLAQTIPTLDTTILIYCNNNFDGDEVNFATKAFTPTDVISAQMANQSKPRMMALNIPTYVNLYGYGYTNVYELDELLSVKDPRVAFEGTLVARRKNPRAP